VAGAFGELAGRHPRLVPDRDPAVSEIVGVVVQHTGVLAGAPLLIRGRLGTTNSRRRLAGIASRIARLCLRVARWGTDLDPTDEVEDQYDEQDDHENTDQAVSRPSDRDCHQFLLWMSAPQLVTRIALLNAEAAGE
jgi:hypothetical protein